eukprot:CAMPEP_0194485804 /NCGR_PEP_ID=MMETSP0253-20130528/6671_1 /TAXON_ID=2966 /ORGANISM="Noctiluca scintillans" /LENGTH=422 /DNA_ID=CAMNT_0039325815 /DNA_START=65 /DNA_END=1330 /DNA_ORIENTATION=-
MTRSGLQRETRQNGDTDEDRRESGPISGTISGHLNERQKLQDSSGCELIFSPPPESASIDAEVQRSVPFCPADSCKERRRKPGCSKSKAWKRPPSLLTVPCSNELARRVYSSSGPGVLPRLRHGSRSATTSEGMRRPLELERAQSLGGPAKRRDNDQSPLCRQARASDAQRWGRARAPKLYGHVGEPGDEVRTDLEFEVSLETLPTLLEALQPRDDGDPATVRCLREALTLAPSARRRPPALVLASDPSGDDPSPSSSSTPIDPSLPSLQGQSSNGASFFTSLRHTDVPFARFQGAIRQERRSVVMACGTNSGPPAARGRCLGTLLPTPDGSQERRIRSLPPRQRSESPHQKCPSTSGALVQQGGCVASHPQDTERESAVVLPLLEDSHVDGPNRPFSPPVVPIGKILRLVNAAGRVSGKDW